MNAGDPLVRAFAHVTFGMGTAAKRFARTIVDWPPDRELSPRAEAFAWRLAYIYRRQLPKALAEEALQRKINHQWVNIGGRKFLLECSACKRQAWQTGSREINAPCPGPPQPRDTKRKKCIGTRGAVPDAESSIVAPQGLFE